MRVNSYLLGLALFFLVVWGLTMLLLRGTVSYALSDPHPTSIDQGTTLESHAGRFVRLVGIPNHDLAVVYQRYGVYSYWYPLTEFDNRLIARVDAPLSQSKGLSPRPFQGRLRPVQQVAFSSYVVRRFLQEKGLELPPDTYVIADGETPELFRPLVLMSIPIAMTWLGVLVAVVAVAVRAFRSRRQH